MFSGAPKPILLTARRVVLPERVLEPGRLVINGTTIEQIFSGELERGLDAYDHVELGDAVLFPGFIDVHIHGAVGVDTMQATPPDLDKVSTFLSRQGTTGWLPTFVPAAQEEYARAINAIAATRKAQSAAEPSCKARVLGVHYEGPFVSSFQCGALHQQHFRTFKSESDLDSLPTLTPSNAIHMMTVAPEIEGGVELVQELTRRGWITSIGHTRAGIELLDQAYSAGARHITHFMNAMPPLHHRDPGPVGWGLSRSDVSCDIIADGIHLDSLVLKLLVHIKTPRRLALISDAIAAAGAGDGAYEIWGETIKVENRRTQNAQGSIAGSVITLLDAVRMMLALGVSEVDVARMAATNPARLLGIDHECGSIEVGKRADLVALEDDDEVRFTMVNGAGFWITE